jgi:DNA adenine methylase
MSATLLGLLMGNMDEEERRRDVLRLPFSYPGSKLDQLEHLLPEIPYRRGFGEAFGGSGIVLLNREPSELEILNDRYMGITSLYRVVRDPAKREQLLERLSIAIHSREEFIWCQSTWRDCADDIERAARWFYTIIFSVNSKPESTFGRATKGKAQLGRKYHNSIPLFHPLSERLKYTQIENLDWRMCLRDYDAEDFVWYLDPTYLGTAKAYEFNMTEEEHVELCERIHNDGKGFFALSGYNNPETRCIYDSYNWDNKYTWQRKTEMLVRCDHMLTKVETKIHSGDKVVTEALWVVDKS